MTIRQAFRAIAQMKRPHTIRDILGGCVLGAALYGAAVIACAL